MVISRTPYRVSFAGGGTDLPAFYRHEPGAVLSVALAKHMYVTVSPRFDRSIRVGYTRTETAECLDAVEHTIVREALRLAGVSGQIEITTIGDLPAGTGMGSSSSLAVGLMQALHAYRGRVVAPARLAEEACRIEIDVLGKPIGRQDQYAAAFGGLNYMRFHPDHTVEVEPVPCRAEVLADLGRRTLLFYTGQTRSADTILAKQGRETPQHLPALRRMRDIAGEMRDLLGGSGDLDGFAALLHEAWELKRSVNAEAAPPLVAGWYDAARRTGAHGGKLLGAGGGGFLLLLAPPDRHAAIRAALDHPREIPFAVDPSGSRLVFIDEQAGP